MLEWKPIFASRCSRSFKRLFLQEAIHEIERNWNSDRLKYFIIGYQYFIKLPSLKLSKSIIFRGYSYVRLHLKKNFGKTLMYKSCCPKWITFGDAWQKFCHKSLCVLHHQLRKCDTDQFIVFLVHARVPRQECICSSTWFNSCSLMWNCETLELEIWELTEIIFLISGRMIGFFSYYGTRKIGNYVSKSVTIDEKSCREKVQRNKLTWACNPKKRDRAY